MKKSKKEELQQKNVQVYKYLKKVKIIGVIGILLSLILFGYDIYSFQKGWYSIFSLIVDFLLLIFSIYFIFRSIKIMNKELQKK